jgi:two-component system sensor histidine kinase/response regulator
MLGGLDQNSRQRAQRTGERDQRRGVAAAGGQAILIVEDDEINCVVAKAMLGKLGCRSGFAHDGRDAVEKALTGEFAAILMDCELPELDGYEATRRIRAAESLGARIPVIAMTANSMPGDRALCLAAGMDDYLSKPVLQLELSAVVSRWVPSARARDDHDVPTSVDRDDEDDQMLDGATVAQLRDCLTSEMRSGLIGTFEQSLPKCIQRLRGALERRDYGEIGSVAHLLKGTSATLGANRLRIVCRRLEQAAQAGTPTVGSGEIDQLQAAAEEALVALRVALR